MNTAQRKQEIEDFFKVAFCGKKATFDMSGRTFKIQGVIEIETGDDRGTIHVAYVKPLK